MKLLSLSLPWKVTVCSLFLASNVFVQWHFFDFSLWLSKDHSNVAFPAWALEVMNLMTFAVNQVFCMTSSSVTKKTKVQEFLDHVTNTSSIMMTARLLSLYHLSFIHPTTIHVATTVMITQQLLKTRFQHHPIFSTWTTVVTTGAIVVGPSLIVPSTLASILIACAFSFFVQ